jgi:hypothetical protein
MKNIKAKRRIAVAAGRISRVGTSAYSNGHQEKAK